MANGNREAIEVEYSSVESHLELVGRIRGNLCFEAERYLYDDIKNHRVALVNDTILMKSLGHHAGIAIREQSIEGGTIELGRWYELSDWRLGSKVSKLAEFGDKRIYLPGAVGLIENRRVRERNNTIRINFSGKELLELTVNAAKRIARQRRGMIEDYLDELDDMGRSHFAWLDRA